MANTSGLPQALDFAEANTEAPKHEASQAQGLRFKCEACRYAREKHSNIFVRPQHKRKQR